MACARIQIIWIILALLLASCRPSPQTPESMQFPDYLKDHDPDKYLKYYEKPSNKLTADELDAAMKMMVEDLKEIQACMASGDLKFHLDHSISHIKTRYSGSYDTPDFKKHVWMGIDTETHTPAKGNIVMGAGINEYKGSSKNIEKPERAGAIHFFSCYELLRGRGIFSTNPPLNSIDVPVVVREYTLEKETKKIYLDFREDQSIESYLMVIPGNPKKIEAIKWDAGKIVKDNRQLSKNGKLIGTW